MDSTDPIAPVLILGAGINGCALARELTLNGIPVWIVDRNDVSFGATSRSSRLIHGGLRYLEYAEFRLVRESLTERRILLNLAPQYVEPLRLFIPVRRRTGGLWFSILKYLSGTRIPLLNQLSTHFHLDCTRGLWLVQLGLWLYDRFAHDPNVAGHSVQNASDADVPRVNNSDFRWLCAYTDAQMRFPERFTLAMLDDARNFANRHQVALRVCMHAAALPHGDGYEITTPDGNKTVLLPSAVVNATGAWGDLTLYELNVPSQRLFGGTRGSHLLTANRALRAALGDGGVYAEADDGRLVFILPFGTDVLVGTTDVRFSARPDQAIATTEELDYLIELVNAVMPDSPLTREDVTMHYSGVRPLPFQPDGKTAAISRDHAVRRHKKCVIPTYTLVGGKLTTCRAFAELAADKLFKGIGFQRLRSSETLPFAGGDGYPRDADELTTRQQEIADSSGLPVEHVRRIWELYGTRTKDVLRSANSDELREIEGTGLPVAIAYRAIDHEWAQSLDDLVERRLMLVYRDRVSRECLCQLAGCLVQRGLLAEAASDATVDATIERLERVYGKHVERNNSHETPSA